MSNQKLNEQRFERRLLCADLVAVRWKDPDGTIREEQVVLEDVSSSGLCLQFDAPLALNTRVSVLTRKSEFPGTVRYCYPGELGFAVGVRFDPGLRWGRRQFLPKHLFDPERLIGR